MHKQWAGLRLTTGWLAFCAIASASAAGLGTGAGSVVLGQPLDFVVQLQLDAAEPLNVNCVSAEVSLGERRVAAGLVRVVVEMTSADSARLRVQTQPVVDEPVVSVQLSAGCTTRMSRRYVVLADPPVVVLMPVGPAFAASPATVPAPPSSLTSAPAQAAAVPQPGAGQASAALPAQATSPGLRPRGRRPALNVPRVANDPAASARRAQARQAARHARALMLVSASMTAAAPARLRLDAAEPAPRAAESIAVEEALTAVAQAASAARAAASAASASAQRMAALESMVEQLRGEAKANRDLAVQLRQRMSQSDGSDLWVLPLMTAVGLLAALAAWLAWRLGRSQRHFQLDWHEAIAAGPAHPAAEAQASRPQTSPIPFVTSQAKPAAVTHARASPAWPPPAPEVSWPAVNSTLPPPVPDEAEEPMQRTEPMPAIALEDESAPRDVSIEELIDLEQQAEFFVALGQDDSAIDLLVDHLRSTGGGSPLPYLKLLEIHHRRDEREAYERMRSRFNHRFNAYAPEWGVGLSHGRTLEDYPEVLPRLEQVWVRPIDAMAELEALLFRKSRGELFDLPAYREVLLLYSLARDLLERSPSDSGSVDLLLPMVSGVEFRATSAAPYMGLDREAFRDTMPPDERPTAPVDFDVSAVERPTSIFDLLDDKPQPPRRK